MSALQDFAETFARAMARQEGFYKAGSKGQRNRNPGNIRPWKKCPLPVANGMILFPSVDAGWEQLHRQVKLNFRRGLTTREFFAGKAGVYAGYCPRGDGDNDPDKYAAFVAATVGILPAVRPDGKIVDAVDRVIVDVIDEWAATPRMSPAQREE